MRCDRNSRCTASPHTNTLHSAASRALPPRDHSCKPKNMTSSILKNQRFHRRVAADQPCFPNKHIAECNSALWRWAIVVCVGLSMFPQWCLTRPTSKSSERGCPILPLHGSFGFIVPKEGPRNPKNLAEPTALSVPKGRRCFGERTWTVWGGQKFDERVN